MLAALQYYISIHFILKLDRDEIISCELREFAKVDHEYDLLISKDINLVCIYSLLVIFKVNTIHVFLNHASYINLLEYV